MGWGKGRVQGQIYREGTQETFEAGLEHEPATFREPNIVSSHPFPFFWDLFPAEAPLLPASRLGGSYSWSRQSVGKWSSPAEGLDAGWDPVEQDRE